MLSPVFSSNDALDPLIGPAPQGGRLLPARRWLHCRFLRHWAYGCRRRCSPWRRRMSCCNADLGHAGDEVRLGSCMTLVCSRRSRPLCGKPVTGACSRASRGLVGMGRGKLLCGGEQPCPELVPATCAAAWSRWWRGCSVSGFGRPTLRGSAARRCTAGSRRPVRKVACRPSRCNGCSHRRDPG